MPLLYVRDMRIRQVEQPLRKMADDRVLVQEFLVVEFLRQKLVARRASDERALVCEHELAYFDKFARLCEYTRFAALLHVEQEDARIDVACVEYVLAVMVVCRRIFNLR